jgi:hypothetical protein
VTKARPALTAIYYLGDNRATLLDKGLIDEKWTNFQTVPVRRQPGLQLVETLYGLVEELDSKTVEQTREIIRRIADLADVTKSIDDRLEDNGSFYQTILFSICNFDINTKIPPNPNGRIGRPGRPRGTGRYRPLQKLVEMLWEGVQLHGGNLYADHKRYGDGGTMIRALELLRPITPKGLLPKTLPVSTIENTITDFKASGRTWFGDPQLIPNSRGLWEQAAMGIFRFVELEDETHGQQRERSAGDG